MDEFFIIAVDIGGTSFRVALADASGNILARNARPTHAHEGYPKGLERITETIRETASSVNFEKVRGIAVASAGPIDPKSGSILTPPSLPGWHNAPLKDSLNSAFGIPVLVESDADMAAVGEHRFGAGRGFDRLIYMTVSTGIGGGIIIDGELLRGSKVSAAEIGHMIVDPKGPVCNCGGRGHLEPVASGTAIARMASERLSPKDSGKLAEMCGGDLSILTAKIVAEAASAEDSLANEVMSEAGSSLGLAITSLIHIFDPEVVIIGGGVANAGELILDPIRRVIAERAMPDFKDRTRVTQSALGDDSGIMGAIAFALDELRPD